MKEEPIKRCQWLIENNRGFLIRDRDWDKIFSDIEKHEESFKRYYPMMPSGDAIFPTIIGAVFMYLCAVGSTWFFGIRLELMVAGAYIGLAADECVRALCRFLRRNSREW